MNEEIKDLALQIAEILEKDYNPHVTVEIDLEGIKMTSVDHFEPTEAKDIN